MIQEEDKNDQKEPQKQNSRSEPQFPIFHNENNNAFQIRPVPFNENITFDKWRRQVAGDG